MSASEPAASDRLGAARRGAGRASVLWLEAGASEQTQAPDCFHDLNLDQVVAALTKGREEYGLAALLYTPARDSETIGYRHEVMRDLERSDLATEVERFAERMRRVRNLLGLIGRLHYQRQRETWLPEAIATYVQAVGGLCAGLIEADPGSRGLQRIREHVRALTGSPAYSAVRAETDAIREALAAVRYTLTIGGNRIRVGGGEQEPDYSREVEAAFARFKQSEAKDYRLRLSESTNMDHVEAAVLEFVAELNEKTFDALKRYWRAHREFADPTIVSFDREAQLYLAYRDYIAPLRDAGLRFSYPEIADDKQLAATDTFDLALSHKLNEEGKAVVCNDWELHGEERIFVVSGPNQGGKTTFARTLGQLHHLARLGLPVPGSRARLQLVDRIFTHFEKREDLSDAHGKLEDDLIRVHEILERASADSLIVMNESFTSTTRQDAALLGKEVIGRLLALDALCVYVTFVEELASGGEAIVSATSMVDPDDPAIRTFKVVRRTADGRAYAAAIAAKYGLGYERLRERVSG